MITITPTGGPPGASVSAAGLYLLLLHDRRLPILPRSPCGRTHQVRKTCSFPAEGTFTESPNKGEVGAYFS